MNIEGVLETRLTADVLSCDFFVLTQLFTAPFAVYLERKVIFACILPSTVLKCIVTTWSLTDV